MFDIKNLLCFDSFDVRLEFAFHMNTTAVYTIHPQEVTLSKLEGFRLNLYEC